MLSPFTGIGNRGGHPANDTPPPPNAPDFTDVPADALGHPRNPSSAESNTGGITASTNVQTATPAAAAIGGALPDFSDIVAACLAHVIFLIQALGLAGGDPGKEDVFQLVKKILEHLAISELDEDSECLIEFMPVEEDRTALIEDISAALAIEGASMWEGPRECNVPNHPAKGMIRILAHPRISRRFTTPPLDVA